MNYILYTLIIVSISSISLSSEETLHSRRPPVEAKSNESYTSWQLMVAEAGAASPKTIYQSNLSLDDASWSSDGSYLAFIVNGKPYSNWDEKEQKWIDGDVGQKLVIMNRGYKQIAEFPDIRRYRWSPDKNQIVMIAGDNYVGGFGFISNKTSVYNIETKAQIEIPCKAYDLYWAKHDNTIYMDSINEKAAFDPVRQSKVDISYHGIYFSDDGLFYFSQSWEGGGFALYRMAGNERVSSQNEMLNRDDLHPYGWLEDSHCLVIWDYDLKKSHIINVETGKSITVNAQPLGQMGAVIRRNEWNDPDFCADTAMLESLK